MLAVAIFCMYAFRECILIYNCIWNMLANIQNSVLLSSGVAYVRGGWGDLLASLWCLP